MQQLLERLQRRLPDVRYSIGDAFYWSPETREIFYVANAAGQRATWSLLHETGHALLNHGSYRLDFELLRLEAAAWQAAATLASEFGVLIDNDHIQDCLDTYRDWLYARSICPRCGNKSIQQSDACHYRCFNCRTVWRVTPSRFCRAYRAAQTTAPASLTFD